MALIGEGGSCLIDEDCSSEQYCYEVSQQCVDYSKCSRYNRLEGTGRSRHPSHCGKCLPSFRAEILSTGEEAIVCKKVEALHTMADSAKLTNAVIWMITAGLFTIVAVTLAIVFRKRLCAMRRKKQKSKQWTDGCLVGPTAPPPENGPFIESGERITNNNPFNNNTNRKDKNRLVNAIPYKEPSWVGTNPDYEHNLDNNSMSVISHLHTGSLLPVNNNSDVWEPVQLTIQGHTSEEIDNDINTDLYQINFPSSSGDSGNASNNDSSGGASPEMNDSQQNRQRGSNILITQKISMNVNVLNEN